MLRILATVLLALLSGFSAIEAHARTAHVRIERVGSAAVTLEGVDMRLDWPEGRASGTLQMKVRRLHAPAVATTLAHVSWRCTLTRQAWQAWRCRGPAQLPGTRTADFLFDYRPAGLDLRLQDGPREIGLQRRAVAPDLTLVDLQALPVAWATGFIARSWPQGRVDKGVLSGRLSIRNQAGGVSVSGPLALRDASLRTRDDSLIAENLNLAGDFTYASGAPDARFHLAGTARGDALLGSTFLSIQGTPARFEIDARASAGGWRFDRVHWVDGQTLRATGSFALREGQVQDLQFDVASAAAGGLRDRYLSGWLAPLGLSEVELSGGLAGRVSADKGLAGLSLDLRPQDFSLRDPGGRFALNGLSGNLAISPSVPVRSALHWQKASAYGLDFGATDLAFTSANGELALREAARIPVFGGTLRFDNFVLRLPRGERSMGLAFALDVADVDFGALSQAIGLPAFRGTLNGTIPKAVYENDVLRLEGGLKLDVFGGHVAFSSLSVERPFGTAPTLVTHLDLDSLDLLRLTEVLGFGSISGRLSGRIHDMRWVDWTPVRFDASLYTVKVPGVPQRISQRAVQNISSVGGSAPTSGLQAKALALFKDFGYSRIGIGCRLVNAVCTMHGLEGASTAGSGPDSFTILQGAGLPRLTVIGHNRRVDWPVLVERLKAVAAGDVKPVIEH